MNRRRNIIFLVAGLALLIVFALFAGRSRQTVLTVRETNMRRATFVTKLPENGVVQRPRAVTIAAMVGGNLSAVFAKPGDHVHAGQLLATVDNPQISSAAESNAQAYRSATARARSARETNSALPAQNQAAVAQARASLDQARQQLTQARLDAASGTQSGLGYGNQTAEGQRLTADVNVAKARTDLREAERLYNANQTLYANKAISRDALEQTRAKLEQARLAATQAARDRQYLGRQLSQNRSLLSERVRAAQDAVAQAQAQLVAAQTNAGLSKAGDVEAAYADAARAGSEYAFAADQAGRTQIRAPFDGVLLSAATQAGDPLRPLQVGDQLQPGQPLFTMAAGDAFIVRAKVDEQDIAHVTAGLRAIVSGANLAGATLPGHVIAVSPVAQKSEDPSSTARQIVTTIRLDRSLPFLRDGMSVDVDIITKEVRDALVVPNDAIVKDGTKRYVFAVRKGKLHRLAVRVGPANDVQTVILSGIAPGETIVSERNDALRDGLSVAAAPASPPPK